MGLILVLIWVLSVKVIALMVVMLLELLLVSDLVLVDQWVPRGQCWGTGGAPGGHRRNIPQDGCLPAGHHRSTQKSKTTLHEV